MNQLKSQKHIDIAEAKATHERQARREQPKIQQKDVDYLKAALEAPNTETFLRLI